MACVRIVLARPVPLKWHVVKAVVTLCTLKWRYEKATNIQFAPVIVAVRDGLYCRVNFTVRLAIHSLLTRPVASKFWLVRPGSGCGLWLINLPVVA